MLPILEGEVKTSPRQIFFEIPHHVGELQERAEVFGESKVRCGSPPENDHRHAAGGARRSKRIGMQLGKIMEEDLPGVLKHAAKKRLEIPPGDIVFPGDGKRFLKIGIKFLVFFFSEKSRAESFLKV